MTTNVWLKESVYKRVTPKGKKSRILEYHDHCLDMFCLGELKSLTFPRNDMFYRVFYQHGIPGGSYMTLLLGGLITVVSRLCRTNIRPIFLPGLGASESPSAFKRGYDITGTILTILCLNYISASFFLGSIRDTLQVWQATDWYGFWLIFGGLAFFYSGSGKALKSFHPSQVARADTMRREGVDYAGSDPW